MKWILILIALTITTQSQAQTFDFKQKFQSLTNQLPLGFQQQVKSITDDLSAFTMPSFQNSTQLSNTVGALSMDVIKAFLAMNVMVMGRKWLFYAAAVIKAALIVKYVLEYIYINVRFY